MGDRRTVAAVLAVMLCLCLAGCSDAPPAPPPVVAPAAPVPKPSAKIAPKPAPAPSPAEPPREPAVPQETVPDDAGIDMDLTGFSPNMLYAEVVTMGLSPEDYVGKVIRITGQFGHFQELDEAGEPISTDEILVCVISDALACCAAGLEFVPEEGSTFSEHYPDRGTMITVTGECSIFTDPRAHFTRIQLIHAHIEEADP